eukprot:TRINITY_DN106745_c0_g1_i1.p1 TRINITY_DN106745_c0_g1~~TRINITY_DN106745_c0_g1_i1.p1  ORF type:complete len:1306 (-),score=323.81 TRINITY_DN106745_c0_g1_i1:42-3959(-)
MSEVEILIKILGARGLREVNPALFEGAIVEPYCICEIMGHDEPSFRTRAASNSEDAPTWNEATQMTLDEGQSLIFMVNYKDDGTDDDLIGWAKLDFDRIVPYGFFGELRLCDIAASDKVMPAFVEVDVKPLPLPLVLDDTGAEQEDEVFFGGLQENGGLIPPTPTAAIFADEEAEETEVNRNKLIMSDDEQLHLSSPLLHAGSSESALLDEEYSEWTTTPEELKDIIYSEKDTPQNDEDVASAIDDLLRRRTNATRPLRQSLAETLQARMILADADCDDEGRLLEFGRRAERGPRSFGQVLAQVWAATAVRSPGGPSSPPSPSLWLGAVEASHRDIPGIGRTLGKAAAARVRALLLHLERTVALDPDVRAEDLLATQDLIAEARGDGKAEEETEEAFHPGKYPPPLVAGTSRFKGEPWPWRFPGEPWQDASNDMAESQVLTSDEEESLGRSWPARKTGRELRSKVKGLSSRSYSPPVAKADAGYGPEPEQRLLVLQEKFEEAHGSLSAAFSSMDFDGRGYVSFGDFHTHLVRLRLSSVDAEGSSKAMELFKLLDSDGDDLLSPRDCLKAFRAAAAVSKAKGAKELHDRRLQAFIREHGLTEDMLFGPIPQRKPLSGDEYSRARSLQRYLVSQYGSLSEALRSMDFSGGLGFVSEANFALRLKSVGYVLSDSEAVELFKAFDPWGKGWLPLQRITQCEANGDDWLLPSSKPASVQISPRSTPRSADASPPPLTVANHLYESSPRGSSGRGVSPSMKEALHLFSDPGRLDGPDVNSPRRQASTSPTRSRLRSASPGPVHERLHAATTRHLRSSGEGNLRSAYHNLDEAKKALWALNDKAADRDLVAKEAAAAAKKYADAAAKVASATGSPVPDSLKAAVTAPPPSSAQKTSPAAKASVTLPLPSSAQKTSPAAKASASAPQPSALQKASPAQKAPSSAPLGSTVQTTSPSVEASAKALPSSAAQNSSPAVETPAKQQDADSAPLRSTVQRASLAVEASVTAPPSSAAQNSSPAVESLVKQQDADGDGVLSQEEFSKLQAENAGLANLDFSEVDKDGDGVISQSELQGVVDWDALATPPEPKDAEEREQEEAVEQVSEEIIKRLDADGDGEISREEVEKLKESNPGLSQLDLSKLDADGDGKLTKEEIKSAITEEVQAGESSSAGFLSVIGGLFGGGDTPAEAPEKDQSQAEAEAPKPKAKALPKSIAAMTKISVIAGRKGSRAVNSLSPVVTPRSDAGQSTGGTSASAQGSAFGGDEAGGNSARKRREARNVRRAAKLATATVGGFGGVAQQVVEEGGGAADGDGNN